MTAACNFDVAIDDGLPEGLFAKRGRKDEGRVSPLGQDVLNVHGENEVFFLGKWEETFRANPDEDILVLKGLRRFQDGLFSQEQESIFDRSAENIDRRGSEEFGDEKTIGVPVDFLRLANLTFLAILHHADAVADRHCFFLIVGDEDRRDFGGLLNSPNLFARLDAKAGIEIGKRFVQKKNPRAFHEGPRDCDALLLASRELARLAAEIILDLDELGGFSHQGVAFVFGQAAMNRGCLAIAKQDVIIPDGETLIFPILKFLRLSLFG